MGSDPVLRTAKACARRWRRIRLRSLSPDDRGTAEIVLAEVLNNIAEHAYARFPGQIRLSLSQADRACCSAMSRMTACRCRI